MTQPPRLHLFQAYGIELEYMIVDRDSLAVKPIADELIKHELGSYGSDFENGIVSWSNELVTHVVELKSTNPENNLNALEHAFSDNIKRINTILTRWNAMLMPSAAHPFMDPLKETKLWPHDNNEVYELYNKMFDCKGHGWSNLQSTHLNLPFYDDEEFAKLHAAVRVVLPLLPALCASSPILDGKLTGVADTRMRYYKTNQSRIPSITGKVIPEAVFSKRNYLNVVYDKIKADIAPYNEKDLLNPIWVNSRGAIPRFDRGSIEIRIMDIQECAAADLAIVTTVIEVLKSLVNESLMPYDQQIKWKTESLARMLDLTTLHGGDAVIDDLEYLAALGVPSSAPMPAAQVWQRLLEKLSNGGNQVIRNSSHEVDVILQEGTLSKRIIKGIGNDASQGNIKAVYRQLAGCLAQNKMFLP